MTFVTIVNVLAVFIVALTGKTKDSNKWWRFIIISLTLCYGIRYMYGNDYEPYSLIFRELKSYSSLRVMFSQLGYEQGWIILNYLLSPLGFEGVVFIQTFIIFGTIGWLYAKYVPPRDRWLALFFYLFITELMLISLSAMRQSVAMAIVCFSIPFIIDKKYFKSIAIILVASLFHTTALFALCIPLIQLTYKISKVKYIIITLSLFVLFYALISYFKENIEMIVTLLVPEYDRYLVGEESELSVGFGTIARLGLMLVALKLDKHDGSVESYFLKIFVFSNLFLPLSFVNGMAARIAWYWYIFTPISFCYIKTYSKNKTVLIALLLFVLLTLVGYKAHFNSEVYGPFYEKYNTILSR